MAAFGSFVPLRHLTNNPVYPPRHFCAASPNVLVPLFHTKPDQRDRATETNPCSLCADKIDVNLSHFPPLLYSLFIPERQSCAHHSESSSSRVCSRGETDRKRKGRRVNRARGIFKNDSSRAVWSLGMWGNIRYVHGKVDSSKSLNELLISIYHYGI